MSVETNASPAEVQTEAPAHGVVLTDVAATKVKSLLEQEGRDDLRLRVGVQPGGDGSGDCDLHTGNLAREGPDRDGRALRGGAVVRRLRW